MHHMMSLPAVDHVAPMVPPSLASDLTCVVSTLRFITVADCIGKTATDRFNCVRYFKNSESLIDTLACKADTGELARRRQHQIGQSCDGNARGSR